jgi:four helix bundle protein
MSGFRELRVWKDAKKLAVDIYKITNQNLFSRDFGLRDQIRRAAVSISSNIAEGDERGTNRESVRYLYIAKGSLAEVVTQLEIAHEIGYIQDETLFELIEQCSAIGRKLGSLIKARKGKIGLKDE